MRKITMAAALLAAGLLAGCGAPASSAAVSAAAESVAESTAESVAESTPSQSEIDATMTTEIANPWVDYATQQEAEAGAGFTMSLPATVDEDFAAPIFRAMPGKILEVVYTETVGDDELRLRKGLTATEGEDITGDYNSYAYTGTLTVGDVTATVKGEDADDLALASWQSGEYSYAVTLNDDVDVDEMTALVEAVK